MQRLSNPKSCRYIYIYIYIYISPKIWLTWVWCDYGCTALKCAITPLSNLLYCMSVPAHSKHKHSTQQQRSLYLCTSSQINRDTSGVSVPALSTQANTNTQQYTAAQHHFSKILFTAFVLAKCALQLPKNNSNKAKQRNAMQNVVERSQGVPTITPTLMLTVIILGHHIRPMWPNKRPMWPSRV